MSQENTTLAWRGAHAWGEGGVAALLPFLDSEVEWHPLQGRRELGAYRGHAGVCEYLARFDERALIEPLSVFDLDDDRVIAIIRVIFRDEFGGEVDGEWACLIIVRAGKWANVRTFTDSEQAFKAAALR